MYFTLYFLTDRFNMLVIIKCLLFETKRWRERHLAVSLAVFCSVCFSSCSPAGLPTLSELIKDLAVVLHLSSNLRPQSYRTAALTSCSVCGVADPNMIKPCVCFCRSWWWIQCSLSMFMTTGRSTTVATHPPGCSPSSSLCTRVIR